MEKEKEADNAAANNAEEKSVAKKLRSRKNAKPVDEEVETLENKAEDKESTETTEE